MLQSVYYLIVILAKSENMAKRHDETKHSLSRWFLNKIRLSEREPRVIRYNRGCSCIFSPQLVKTLRQGEIVRVFQQTQHRRCLPRVIYRFHFLIRKGISDLTEKMHKPVVNDGRCIGVGVCGIHTISFDKPTFD